MADTIKTGTALIEEGTLIPETLRFESEPWTSFYMAGESIRELRKASGKQSKYGSEGNMAHSDIVIMQQTIKAGTILIEDGTSLPEALRFESEACVPGWRSVKDMDGYGLDRKIHEAGWAFFYLAGEFKTTVLGFDRQKMVRRAVKQILANLKSEKFNSLEITGMASKRFLGVPYVTVSAHSRHIQESVFLFRAKDLQERDRARLAAAA